MRGLGTLLNMAAIGVGASVGTLLGDRLPQRLRDTLVAAMTAVGGLLVIAIGLRLLGLARIRVANLLPAVLLTPLATGLLAATRKRRPRLRQPSWRSSCKTRAVGRSR